MGSRQSRLDNHSDDWIDALLCEFPATGHLKRVEDVHAEMQIVNFSRHMLVKPEILCGRDPIHPSEDVQLS